MNQSSVRVPKQDLEQYVYQVFLATGLDEQQSAMIARHLVFANLRGIESHGVSRVSIYTRRLEHGLVNKKMAAKTERETASSMLIDGANSSGIVLSTIGMQTAVKKAKDTGIAVVGIKNSNHCGMLADYTMYAADHDCIAFATTNAPAMMAPWGGKARFFGTNPFSYGIPAGSETDIIFDMATSVVARGKIILAQKNNQQIPVGWAISKNGKPTTDPAEALQGLILPVGGPKGYGIAFLVETLSSLFTGAAFGPYVSDLFHDFKNPQNVGQCFIVMRADLFQNLHDFKARIDQMIQEIRSIPLMEGVDRIYLPGELEREKTAERLLNGIPLSREMIQELIETGKQFGVANDYIQNLSEM